MPTPLTSALVPQMLQEYGAVTRAAMKNYLPAREPRRYLYDLLGDYPQRAGKMIHLTPREYALLEFLAFHLGKVVSRSMIWEHLYNEEDETTSNVVDVFIRYLRNKIDKDHDVPLILTRWGEGYLLRGDEPR